MKEGRYEPKVSGHGRLSRQQRNQTLMHFQVAAVELVVTVHDDLCQFDVLVGDRLQRAVKGHHDHVEALQGLLLEAGQFFLVGNPDPAAVSDLGHGQPTLPVT
jgi:hypothetical protein